MIRHSGLIMLALAALGIAGWTYSVNYDTRAALDRISDLRMKIVDEREAIRVLRVEWAWLNRPDRLARLVDRYEEKLALVPLTPKAFGYVAAVPYPPGEPKDAPASALIARAPPGENAGTAATMPQIALADQDHPTVAGGIRPGATAALPSPIPAGDGLAEGSTAGILGVSPASAEAGSAPTSMNEAVTLALIEAGVLQPDEPTTSGSRGGATAAASRAPAGGIPVPPARPAMQVPR